LYGNTALVEKMCFFKGPYISCKNAENPPQEYQ